MLKKLLTCQQVAERYGVKIETVWAWIRNNKLPAIQIGKQYRIEEDALEQFEKASGTK